MWILDILFSGEIKWLSVGLYANKDELDKATRTWLSRGYKTRVRGV